MKLLTLGGAIFILFLQTAKSQDSLMITKSEDFAQQHSTYVVRINRFYSPLAKGYLVTIHDSSLYMSRERMPLNFGDYDISPFQKINYRAIQQVRLSKPHALGKSFLIGAVIGIVVGAIIGHAQGSDSGIFGLSSGDKGVLGGFIGAGAGCITGAVIAKASEKSFLINGEWKSLQDMKETLQNNK